MKLKVSEINYLHIDVIGVCLVQKVTKCNPSINLTCTFVAKQDLAL